GRAGPAGCTRWRPYCGRSPARRRWSAAWPSRAHLLNRSRTPLNRYSTRAAGTPRPVLTWVRSQIPGGAVDLFAQDVRVPRVPGVLADQVQVDPAQRHPAAAGVRDGVVECVAGREPPGGGAGRLVLREDVGDRLLRADRPAVRIAEGVAGDLLPGYLGEVVLQPVALHGGGVLDQPDERGQRGHEAAPGILVGQAAQLADERVAV